MAGLPTAGKQSFRMVLNNHNQAEVRDYLLGHLNDAEQEKMEERLMLDEQLFEELEISKGELIEEYRAGELNQKERDWFERNYLSSDEGKQKYTFILALEQLKAPQPIPQPGWSERLQAFFRTSSWRVPTATATAVVLAAIAIGLFWPRQPQRAIAVQLSNSALTRSANGGQYTRVALRSNVSEVRMTLTLPEGAPRGVSYRAELDNRHDQLKPLKPTAQDANSVSVVIPANELPTGLYALGLYAIQADGSEQAIPGYYFFAVDRED